MAAAAGAAVITDAVPAGVWKKYSMKPAAKRKWANKMPPIKITDLVEFCRAGLKMIIRTVPVDNAAPNTSNHWKNETGINQSTDTGM